MKNLKDIIYDLELSLVSTETRHSADALDKLLADDFIEFGSKGLTYTKQYTIDSLTSGETYAYELYDFEVFELSDTVVQSRFKTKRTNPDGSTLVSLRSSIWKNNNGNWQMYFHQGTPAI